MKLLVQGLDYPQRTTGQEGEARQGPGVCGGWKDSLVWKEAPAGISGACGIHQGALELMLHGCISWRLNHNLWCGRLGKRG